MCWCAVKKLLTHSLVPTPHQRLCPWTPLGHSPQTVIGSLSRALRERQRSGSFFDLCVSRDVIKCDPILQTICCHHMCSYKLKIPKTVFVWDRAPRPGSPVLHLGSLRRAPRPHNGSRGKPLPFLSLLRFWRLDRGSSQRASYSH